MFINFVFVRSAFLVVVLSLTFMAEPPGLPAQGPKGRDFGFGISLGEPLGATVHFWLDRKTSIAASIGGSYFGAPRLGGDYLFHFDVFRSQIVRMYAGPGVALGFGREGKGLFVGKDRGKFFYRKDGGVGIGVRVVAGVLIIPRNTPIEIFAELGPMIGLIPNFGSALDLAVGIRFYP